MAGFHDLCEHDFYKQQHINTTVTIYVMDYTKCNCANVILLIPLFCYSLSQFILLTQKWFCMHWYSMAHFLCTCWTLHLKCIAKGLSAPVPYALNIIVPTICLLRVPLYCTPERWCLMWHQYQIHESYKAGREHCIGYCINV